MDDYRYGSDRDGVCEKCYVRYTDIVHYSTRCATKRCTKNCMKKEGKAAMNEDSKYGDTTATAYQAS